MAEKFIHEKYVTNKSEGLLRYRKLSIVLLPLKAEKDIRRTSKTTWEKWHIINPFASRKLMLTYTDKTQN
jgi:hypothetical protein